MGKRQEAALETRKKLLDAGRSLLCEKAAEQLNIEEITRKAGVAKGSFYTHFKRREDLFSEIALDEYNTLPELVDALPSDCDVCERLASYLLESVKIIEKNTLEIAQQWMKNVVAPLECTQCGTKKYHFDYNNIRRIIEKAVLSGLLKSDAPVDILTESIMNHYYGAVTTWCIQRGEAGDLLRSMENYCTYTLDIIINQYR